VTRLGRSEKGRSTGRKSAAVGMRVRANIGASRAQKNHEPAGEGDHTAERARKPALSANPCSK
jgi:hypothetical protein